MIIAKQGNFLWDGNTRSLDEDDSKRIIESIKSLIKGQLNIDDLESRFDEAKKTASNEEVKTWLRNVVEEYLEDTKIIDAFKLIPTKETGSIFDVFNRMSKGKSSADMGFIKEVIKLVETNTLQDLIDDPVLQRQIALKSSGESPKELDILEIPFTTAKGYLGSLRENDSSPLGRFNVSEDITRGLPKTGIPLKDSILDLNLKEDKYAVFINKGATITTRLADGGIRFTINEKDDKLKVQFNEADSIIFKTKKEFSDWQETTKKRLLMAEGIFTQSKGSSRKNKKVIKNLKVQSLDEYIRKIEQLETKDKKIREMLFTKEFRLLVTEMVLETVRENDRIIIEYLEPILNNPSIVSGITLEAIPILKTDTSVNLLGDAPKDVSVSNDEFKLFFKYLALLPIELTKGVTKTLTTSKNAFWEPTNKDTKIGDTIQLKKEQLDKFITDTFGTNEFSKRLKERQPFTTETGIDKVFTDGIKLFKSIFNELKKEGKPVQFDWQPSFLSGTTKKTSSPDDKKGTKSKQQELGGLTVKEDLRKIIAYLHVDVKLTFNYDTILEQKDTSLNIEQTTEIEDFIDALEDVEEILDTL
tara:strand:+ start:24245 stop:26002 length:1758 start_codon:yes stop_codon:yes gene_type:complete